VLCGIDETFKIVIVALAGFFPVALAAFDGIRGVLEGLVRGRARLSAALAGPDLAHPDPATLPSMLTGLRVGLTRAWVVLIAAELLAADSGIGQMMEMGRQLFRIDVVLAGVVGQRLDRLRARSRRQGDRATRDRLEAA
jgi:sulfonate transport system permease protein